MHLLALRYGTPVLEVHPKGSRRRGATLPSAQHTDNNRRCALWDMHLPIVKVFRNNSMQMVSNRLCRCLILTILVPHSKLRIKSCCILLNDMQLHSSSALERTYEWPIEKQCSLFGKIHLAELLSPSNTGLEFFNIMRATHKSMFPSHFASSDWRMFSRCGGGGMGIQIRGTWY